MSEEGGQREDEKRWGEGKGKGERRAERKKGGKEV